MSLIEQLKDAQKAAMRAKEKARLGTIRLALAAIKQVEVDTQTTLGDDEITAVLTKMVKQRRDSIKQYEGAGRQDLADVEAAEVLVLQEFLPQPLSEAELDSLIEKAMADAGASSMQDMGKVMGLLKPQVQGRADMAVVSQQIKARLG
ncbi:GatB/YqeY domain-containing protein [Ferrimonas balearica]|uniref:GatB/YqeY domain-containing protein n=1 Tax=Ferrimonas balearica TaxID=44012 RepID=UPI001C99C0DB|nr:GatB/YqeY domain-containing protein [Ferrimonas balearica]MBY5923407.1 GatB/YqeY domain-containing protein [Ferrimonas balearica]MBY5995157.1 GatB/YqeY domain-containing protein [Ferrimonas balearica]